MRTKIPRDPPRNPVLRGFHPDPSWVRVEGWTYLVTSTFAWLPGLPVFRSRDHVVWERLPPAIPDTRHLVFSACACDDGLYAPGIRHDGRRFLLSCTLVHRKTQRFQNFICTTTRPEAGWSEPVMLPESLGRIDPTPFADDDGSIWLVLNDLPAPGGAPGATRSIRLWRLDPVSLQPTDGPFTLWHGAMLAAATPEAPRLFKRDGWYWLLIAEGGTGPDHAVTLARSRDITGPYSGVPANPLLTHRHLGPDMPVQCVGHADLLRMEDGSWRACCLAERRHGELAMTGRETWTVPVVWPEDGWPVFAPGLGRLECNGEPGPSVDPAWIGLRQTPSDRGKAWGTSLPFLRAHPDPDALVGRRIAETEGRWRATLRPEGAVGAHGIALFSTETQCVRLKREGGLLTLLSAGEKQHAVTQIAPSGPLTLELRWNAESCQASFGTTDDLTPFGPALPATLFARPVFCGAVAAVWCEGDTGGLNVSLHETVGC